MNKLSAVLLGTLLSAGAFGAGCPGKVAEIDNRLASAPMLDAGVIDEVITLRTEGEAAHQQGRHADAMEALSEALEILDEAEAG